METTLTVPQGTFELHRPGLRSNSPMRAWDGADIYLLETIDHQTDSTLLVNDAFGALAVAMAESSPVSLLDSLVAQRAAAANLARNNLAEIRSLSSVDRIDFAPELVIIKIPRTLALLEHQLRQIRAVASPDTTVVGAGMVKHVHTSTLQLFERILGPTTTSLAKKKARLIYPTLDPNLVPGPSPWPQTVDVDGGFKIVVEPGVFAGTRLDIGARVLLDALPHGAERAVDLGCGNGILGSALAKQMGAEVTFVDESFLAIRSARATFELNNPGGSANFLVDDAGSSLPSTTFDLVLNNPPFHENNAVTDATAWRMFNEARRILIPDGELRVVANRHLGYHSKLKQLFGNCETVHSTKKFVVLKTIR